MNQDGPRQIKKNWPRWTARQKGVFAAAFAMGLSDPFDCVKAIELLDLDENRASDPAHVVLARQGVDITDQQFLSWWGVANTIALRLRTRPTPAQAQCALDQYRAFQQGSLDLPIVPFQSLSHPAKLAWPVLFLNQATTAGLSCPDIVQARARLADEKCLALAFRKWEIDLAGYSHHARHLFGEDDFRAWLAVERLLSGDQGPVDEHYIRRAQKEVAMALSDFS